MNDTTVPDAPAVMCTGHRHIEHPALVLERLETVLTRLDASVAVTGGAEGADTLFAQAAANTNTPYIVILPNRWYRANYPDSIDDTLYNQACGRFYAVDRPDVDDWQQRWGRERWWQDNFARNREMINSSELTIVVSAHTPQALLNTTKGGTAACVKDVLRVRGDGHRVIWVPDRPDHEIMWVGLHTTDQLQLR